MKLSVLTDDKVSSRGKLAEHGLSLFLETEQTKLLFDTGQTDVYCRNAEKMGVKLKETDFIVLSHGHYDHCDGLPFFPKMEKMPRIYIRKSALNKRYIVSASGESRREIGISWSPEEYDRIKPQIVFADNVMEVRPGIILCGGVPMDKASREATARFYMETEAGIVPDTMQDEQMLVLERKDGLCVFLGCSHPGIINCLNYVLSLFPGKKISVLAAGMHLENATAQQLDFIIARILEMEIEKVFPLHCTGIVAISEMKRRLKDRCRILYAGDSLEF